MLQVSRMSMPFEIWSSSTLRHVILWSIKAIKIGLKFLFPVCGINFRIQHLTVLLSIIVWPSITIVLWSPYHVSFLTVSSISLWSYTFWSTCYFLNSSRHAIQAGVSETKIISLYFLMVSLMASSSSSFVFIQFRQGIFNFFASSNSDVLFIYY